MTAVVLFIILVVLGTLTAGIANLIVMIIWPFMYNKHYTTKLIEKGYEFCDSEEANVSASAAIGLSR